jgi:hypothetical protein
MGNEEEKEEETNMISFSSFLSYPIATTWEDKEEKNEISFSSKAISSFSTKEEEEISFTFLLANE